MTKQDLSENLYLKFLGVSLSAIRKFHRAKNPDAEEIVLNAILNLIVSAIKNADLEVREKFIAELSKQLMSPLPEKEV